MKYIGSPALLRLFQLLTEPFSCYYLGGAQTLPPPLSREEEAETIRRAEDGDRRAKETLIERNLRLVMYIAKKFESTGIDQDDLSSIGTIGLIKAIDTFRSDRGIKLATYASRCIENEILMHIRKTSHLRREVSLDEPLNTDWDGNELHLSDVLGTDGDCVSQGLEATEDKKTVARALMHLRERERRIIVLRFGLSGQAPLTQKEVADLLGISQSYISRIEKKTIAVLRQEIEGKI